MTLLSRLIVENLSTETSLLAQSEFLRVKNNLQNHCFSSGPFHKTVFGLKFKVDPLELEKLHESSEEIVCFLSIKDPSFSKNDVVENQVLNTLI